MSDLSLLAAAFAQITAADQPNPNQPEPPVIAGASAKAKHQAVQPIAIALHQASIDTYRAEFSRVSTSSATLEALPVQVIPAAEAQPTPAIRRSQPQALETRTIASPGKINLAETIPNILPEPVQLSLRPILTRQGGSISALPPKIRPIALKLHQASIETYANTLAIRPVQETVAREPEAKEAKPVQRLQPGTIANLSQQQAAISIQSPTLTSTVALSPAALALGMAQAAGAAQSVADAAVTTPAAQANPAETAPIRQSADQDADTLKADSLLASAPVVVTPAVDAPPQKLSAAQAAIALDRRVRSELDHEAMDVSKAQRQAQQQLQTAADSPLWASPGSTSVAGTTTPTTVQLSPEAVAQANAEPGSQTSVPEPSIAIAPGAKQAIAAAPLASRTASRPSLSPLQLPQPNNGPRSGPQLYQQRLAALKQGRLYSRLPIDSFKAIWQGVRHKPSYGQWKRLLAAEARAVGGGQGNNRLSVVLGDSLSLWLPMQQLPNSQLWLNQGISGDTTAGILKRLEPLKETRPSNIYLMAGVNDLKNGATDDQVAENLQQIMSSLRQQHPQAQIHVQSILPASIGLAPGRIQALNARIARIAQAEQVAFLDIYPQFAAPNGQMMAQLTTDGIHLSPQGYALWQSILHRMAEPWAFANGGNGLLGRS